MVGVDFKFLGREGNTRAIVYEGGIEDWNFYKLRNYECPAKATTEVL